MIKEVIFYTFSSVLICSSLAVILFKNPVYSAVSLILSFITSGLLWLLLEAEFLAIVLILVYVGAVMVLFLFVFVWLRASFPRYRYDQLMTLGWKVLIPITIIWIGGECVMFTLEIGPWSVT